MAAVIDERLKEAETEQNITENFNRVLKICDALSERVQSLEEKTSAPLLESLSFPRIDETYGPYEWTLNPEFSPEVFSYTADESEINGIVYVNAVPADEAATIAISVDGDAVADIADPIDVMGWGEHVIEIMVSNGLLSSTYTVTVTITE